MNRLRIAEPGILDQEPGYFIEERENAIVREMFRRAKEIGRSPVMNGLVNLYRNNIKTNRLFGKKIQDVFQKLQEEPGWEDIPGIIE